jgi:hypothetical protein
MVSIFLIFSSALMKQQNITGSPQEEARLAEPSKTSLQTPMDC